jgi:hypothetical protein
MALPSGQFATIEDVPGVSSSGPVPAAGSGAHPVGVEPTPVGGGSPLPPGQSGGQVILAPPPPSGPGVTPKPPVFGQPPGGTIDENPAPPTNGGGTTHTFPDPGQQPPVTATPNPTNCPVDATGSAPKPSTGGTSTTGTTDTSGDGGTGLLTGNLNLKCGCVAAPTEFYVSPEDVVQVTVWSSVANVAVVVAGRVLTATGAMVPFTETITVNADRAGHVTSIALPAGFLLAVTAMTADAGIQRGVCFVSIGIASGAPTSRVLTRLLLQDYVVSNTAVGWPGGQIKSSVEGPGRVYSDGTLCGTNGLPLYLTVPDGVRWRVMGLAWTVNLAAGGGGRFPNLTFITSLQITYQVAARVAVPGGSSLDFSAAAASVLDGAAPDYVVLPIPSDLYMVAGDQVEFSLFGFAGGDLLCDVSWNVEEWIQT